MSRRAVSEAPETVDIWIMAYCPFCMQGMPPDATRCPHCGRDKPDDIFDLSATPPEVPDQWQSVAEYALERPARCSHCRQAIRTVRVLRMSRTQVAFTSTLPRGGRAIVCPGCEAILSLELAAF